MASTIGIDIGGTKMLGVVLGADGEVLREAREASPHAGIDALVTTAVAIVEQLVAPGAAIGVGAAGLVDRSGNLRYAPNLPARRAESASPRPARPVVACSAGYQS